MFFMNTVEPAPMKVILGLAWHGCELLFDVQAAISKAARTSRCGVFGLGVGQHLVDRPCSTILPFCMTITRWQSARTTLRSWEMKR